MLGGVKLSRFGNGGSTCPLSACIAPRRSSDMTESCSHMMQSKRGGSVSRVSTPSFSAQNPKKYRVDGGQIVCHCLQREGAVIHTARFEEALGQDRKSKRAAHQPREVDDIISPGPRQDQMHTQREWGGRWYLRWSGYWCVRLSSASAHHITILTSGNSSIAGST
eukprot:SAG31_NODE_16186_length_719_cov_1.714516_1_plen_165_part_00